MSKKCCKDGYECVPCCENNSGCGGIFSGLGSGITPIIFLLIACSSGLLCSNSSILIILVFLLCGGDSISNLLGSC